MDKVQFINKMIIMIIQMKIINLEKILKVKKNSNQYIFFKIMIKILIKKIIKLMNRLNKIINEDKAYFLHKIKSSQL